MKISQMSENEKKKLKLVMMICVAVIVVASIVAASFIINNVRNSVGKNMSAEESIKAEKKKLVEKKSEKNEASVILAADESGNYSDFAFIERDGEKSYYADMVFDEVKEDLMDEYEIDEKQAEDILYDNGLMIYSCVDAEIQGYIDNYCSDDGSIYSIINDNSLQSAIVVIDVSTGQVKAVSGGNGDKSVNRALDYKRQPGSLIKPLAVYAPALEENVINLASYIDNSEIDINGWRPYNSNGRFSGPVSVKTAVSWSYNIPAVNILQTLGTDSSYDYVKNKLHMASLVDSEVIDGTIYSDKNLASLSFGLLTNGVKPIEVSSAYAAIANGGTYIEPVTYTKVCNKNGDIIIEKNPESNMAFSPETAFLTQELLKGVVIEGTAAGNYIDGMDTCGNTGVTDDGMDKWFVGFTPYYCTTVWVGYDTPKYINISKNPAIDIWKDIMSEIHINLDSRGVEKPSGIVTANVCGNTGKYASGSCGSTVFANQKFLTGNCGCVEPVAPATEEDVFVPETPETPEVPSPTQSDNTQEELKRLNEELNNATSQAEIDRILLEMEKYMN